jgi:hypothetical protein
VVCNNILVNIIVVDYGASTCVMSLSCWKDIGSPKLTPYPTFLTAFDGHSFQPRGLVPSCSVTLGGNSICMEFEVFDPLLNYNLLLGRSWTYSITTVILKVFWIIFFPHEERIVTNDQVESNLSNVAANHGTIIPWIENSQATTKSISCGMYPSLMGYFDSPAPISYIHTTPFWHRGIPRVQHYNSAPKKP